MKLAEALILRADTQKKINHLRERIQANAKVQEGEQPSESVAELFSQFDGAIAQFNTLVKQINRTNAATAFDETRTLTDALADRDTLKMERANIELIVNTARVREQRFMRTEIKFVTTIDVSDLQKRSDDLAQQYRELDTTIQQMNWTVDVLE